MVGVQTPPHHDLAGYDALREMGVNQVSFCFEIMEYGQARHLDAIRYCGPSVGRDRLGSHG